jgi:hypothetical protein
MICRCEVLWGAVGPHRAGEKIDLSEADADRYYKIGAVRILYKSEEALNVTPETSIPDTPATKPAAKVAKPATPRRSAAKPAKK